MLIRLPFPMAVAALLCASCVATYDTSIGPRPDVGATDVDGDGGDVDGGVDSSDAAVDSDAGGPDASDVGGDVSDAGGDADACDPNACGGCEALADELGDPCGECGNGEFVCDGQNGLSCDGDECAATVPTNVQATDGAFEARVRVSWTGVEGATAYRVYRGGVEVAEVEGGTTLWDDTTAPAAAAPGAPELTASDDRSDGIELTWTRPDSPEAESVTYAVSAIVNEVESDLSSTDTGFRGARGILGFEWSAAGGDWVALGTEESAARTVVVSDESVVPLGAVLAGTVAASDGNAVVSLQATGFSVQTAAPVSFRVRATTATGPGLSSDPVEGQRATGSLTYRWESAAAATGTFSTISGAAAAASSTDPTAPADGSVRYYRVVASAAGAAPFTSASDAGNLGIVPPQVDDLEALSRPDKVTLTWSGVTGAVTGYEVSIDSGTWTSVGNVTTWDDTTAPAPTISPCSEISVSAGTRADGVELSCVTGGVTAPAARSYRVRAVNTIGASEPSDAASNTRTIPTVLFQWDRSAADSDASYSQVLSVSDRTTLDNTISAGQFRYWRVRVSPQGIPGSPTIPPSAGARGYRAGAPTVSTLAATGVSSTGATLQLNIAATNSATLTRVGWCVVDSSYPGDPRSFDAPPADSCLEGATEITLDDVSAAGNFSEAISLVAGRDWRVFAFAANVAGITYGSEVNFTTE